MKSPHHESVYLTIQIYSQMLVGLNMTKPPFDLDLKAFIWNHEFGKSRLD